MARSASQERFEGSCFEEREQLHLEMAVDPPSRYLMIDGAADGVEWEHVTTDKMFKMLCKAVRKTIEENLPDLAESDIPTASQSTSDTRT